MSGYLKFRSAEAINAGNEWRIRVRFWDTRFDRKLNPNIARHTEIHGIGAGYTMHQAQVTADSIRREYA